MIGWFQSSSSARRNGGGPMRRRHRAVPWHGIRIRHNIAQSCQAQRRASEYLRTVGKPPNASEHQRRYVDRRDASKVLSRRPKHRPDKMRRFRRSRIRPTFATASRSRGGSTLLAATGSARIDQRAGTIRRRSSCRLPADAGARAPNRSPARLRAAGRIHAPGSSRHVAPTRALAGQARHLAAAS